MQITNQGNVMGDTETLRSQSKEATLAAFEPKLLPGVEITTVIDLANLSAELKGDLGESEAIPGELTTTVGNTFPADILEYADELFMEGDEEGALDLLQMYKSEQFTWATQQLDQESSRIA